MIDMQTNEVICIFTFLHFSNFCFFSIIFLNEILDYLKL